MKSITSLKFQLSWIIILLVIAFGCAPKINEPNDNLPSAQVRFIHSASTAAPLDFSVLNTAGGSFTLVWAGTEYGRQYRYNFFRPGERQFGVFLSQAGLKLSTATSEIENEKKYTVLAVDLQNAVDTSLLILSDTTGVPEDGKAWVRFINAMQDDEDLSIIFQGLEISGLSRRTVSPFYIVAEGSALASVNLEGTFKSLESTLTFFSKGVYTVIISGSKATNASIKLNLKTYIDSGV